MKIKKITDVASGIGLSSKDYLAYGDFKAKVKLSVREKFENRKEGKLIFVTSINPTPSGEGKTTTSIGLAQSLNRMGKKALLCLRQPSLGPVFGRKGGAAGGGKASLYPFSDVNLHLTGDFHAITAAHNLLAAVIDNHIYWGNKLGIDKDRVLWDRVLDVNDRTLRDISIGLSLKDKGYPRNSGFKITSASELMAILALFKNRRDIERMISRIMVAYDKDGAPVYAKDLKVVPAISLLLKDAMMPNLIQTQEGDPVFVHTGPFANIAHGNSSLVATEMALKLADYVITEGGFGSDLGFEKFIDIVARKGGFKISSVVLVVSLRALKYHGGLNLENINRASSAALKKGLANLSHHIGIVRRFNLEPVVCINRFKQDKDSEIESLKDYCSNILGVEVAVSDVYAKGSKGGYELAEKVLSSISSGKSEMKTLYGLNQTLKSKILKIAEDIYGASGVDYTKEAEEKIDSFQSLGYGKLPVSIAKTQFSLTHNPRIKGVREDWRLLIKDVVISSGAGFLIPITGDMLLLPGLPKHPVLENIKFSKGEYQGLF
ncbi:MAG: formate--tetrahydrofolate ligase [Candidatus Kaelpia aquatica]|nr:formate--tetrahydrofolate ligase [Candidatus Kaelpia aquatica]